MEKSETNPPYKRSRASTRGLAVILRVWHSGPGPTPDAVNGVDQTVWALAEAQSAFGHDVAILFDGGGTSSITSGVTVAGFQELRHRPPDLIHMHSVFNPAQARLARWADRRGVPYIVTPHGGVAPQILGRGSLKKAIYSSAIERPRFRQAAAITAVTESEHGEISSFVRGRGPTIAIIPNAVRLPPADIPDWRAEDVVYLGRLDVQHKGIDRLTSLAAQLPNVSFGIYGKGRRGELPPLPSNVTLHSPIYGVAKWAVLRAARLYLQPSRWEAFGLTICEAALVGTQPVLAKQLHLAERLTRAGATTIDFDDSPEVQATQLSQLLSRDWTSQDELTLRNNVLALVSPPAVAQEFDRLYEAVQPQR